MNRLLITVLIAIAAIVTLVAWCTVATGRTDNLGVVNRIQTAYADGTVPAAAKYSPQDWDLDGCTQAEEAGIYPSLGGLRDPKNPWDFFDTPPRDGYVTMADILRVAGRFGKFTGDAGYSEAFDRSFIGPNSWNLGPPNGSTTMADIFMVARQFGNMCRAVPFCAGNVHEATKPAPEVTVSEGTTYALDCALERDALGPSRYTIGTADYILTEMGVLVGGDTGQILDGNLAGAKIVPSEGGAAGWCRDLSCPSQLHYFVWDAKKDWTACLIFCLMQQHLVVSGNWVGVFGGPLSGVISEPINTRTSPDANFAWRVDSYENPPGWNWTCLDGLCPATNIQFHIHGQATYSAGAAGVNLRSETRECEFTAGPFNQVRSSHCW